jgi:hypothetical protein
MVKGGRCARWRPWLIAAICTIPAIGCGGSSDIDPATAASLKGMAGMYVEYAMSHQNVGPPDAETLKKHARALDPRTAGGAGFDISRLDEYFVSPRDKQPLQVRYGVPVSNLGRGAPIIAHEQTGVKGKKLAVYANNKIEELDDAGLKQALEGKSPTG